MALSKFPLGGWIFGGQRIKKMRRPLPSPAKNYRTRLINDIN